MEQLELPFKVEDLREGDKVRILGKSMGRPMDKFKWRKRDVAYVAMVYEPREWDKRIDYTLYFLAKELWGRVMPGYFRREDLQKVRE